MCFFKVKHTIGHISGTVGPIDMKRKGSALVGYWLYYVTLTYDLTHDLDLIFFKVKHSIGHISGMVGPIDEKRKGGSSVGYGVNYVTLTFDLTHDLDLRFFKFKFWNSCISGIIGLIDVKWKVNQLDAGLTTVHNLALWPHSWPWGLRATVWNSLISGMGVSIYMVWKESESSIHDHDIDFCDHGGMDGGTG